MTRLLARLALLASLAATAACGHSRYVVEDDELAAARERVRAHSSHTELAARRPDGTPVWLAYEDVEPGSAVHLDETTSIVLVRDERESFRTAGYVLIPSGVAAGAGAIALATTADEAGPGVIVGTTLLGSAALYGIIYGGVFLVRAATSPGPERELAAPPDEAAAAP